MENKYLEKRIFKELTKAYDALDILTELLQQIDIKKALKKNKIR